MVTPNTSKHTLFPKWGCLTWKNIDRKMLSLCVHLMFQLHDILKSSCQVVGVRAAVTSVLVKVRGPVLVFNGEGFESLGYGFVLLLLLLLLSEGKTRGDACGGGAVAGCGPHGGL